MSVLNFATTRFKLLKEPNLTIDQINDLITSGSAELFVVHDPHHHASAVVIPEVFQQIRETLRAAGAETAFATGLLDALRDGQIVVGAEQPAARVAALAHARNAGIVIVVNATDEPVGLFVPATVMQRLPQSTFIQSRSTETLKQKVAGMSQMVQFPSILDLVEKEHPDFASERLNQIMTEALVCDGGATSIKHTPVKCPCEEHDPSQCGARKVSQ
jgi:hypothetical protein